MKQTITTFYGTTDQLIDKLKEIREKGFHIDVVSPASDKGNYVIVFSNLQFNPDKVYDL